MPHSAGRHRIALSNHSAALAPDVLGADSLQKAAVIVRMELLPDTWLLRDHRLWTPARHRRRPIGRLPRAVWRPGVSVTHGVRWAVPTTAGAGRGAKFLCGPELALRTLAMLTVGFERLGPICPKTTPLGLL
jgi:hypothetical protein